MLLRKFNQVFDHYRVDFSDNLRSCSCTYIDKLSNWIKVNDADLKKKNVLRCSSKSIDVLRLELCENTENPDFFETLSIIKGRSFRGSQSFSHSRKI